MLTKERWRQVILCSVFLFLLSTSVQTASLKRRSDVFLPRRTKRGFLSKNGMCPDIQSNLLNKDNRLNFFGNAVMVPSEESVDCRDNDCQSDNECDADKKCCLNHCGASICTPAERDPHPCRDLVCPEFMICKIERVRCTMPDCPDLYSRSRPGCVPTALYYAHHRKRSKIPRPAVPSSDEVHFHPKDPYTSSKDRGPFTF